MRGRLQIDEVKGAMHERRRRSRWGIGALIPVVSCLLPAAISGQGITGVVRDSITSAPLSGVLISVLNGDSARVRGVLTDAEGRFDVEVPLGRYRLQAERIGLRPVTTEPFDVATFNRTERDLLMTDRAVEIQGLVVDARLQACRIDPEGALRIQRWWQEIKTALAASSVLARERFADFRVERFEREWDDELERILASNSRTEVRTSSQPFVAEEAEFLVDGGFVQGEITGQRQYYAPDADVLLSDLFLARHCFSLVEDDDREDQLGLRFEPTLERDVADIDGTLWVDTTTAELQNLDFRYANVEDVPENESGGFVAFDYLESGAWIVSEWYIRMPRLTVRGRPEQGNYVLLGYMDVGGEVEPFAVARPADVPGREGAIRGVVFDSIRGVGIPDATVSILGTRFSAVTDPAGAFAITNVPVGEHALTFSHPDTDAWGLGSTFIEVEVEEDRTESVELAVPSFGEAALALCLGEGVNARTIVITRTVSADGTPLPFVDLEFRWYERGADDPRVIPVSTDRDGRVVLCSIPGDARVTVRAEVSGQWRDLFDISPPSGQITYREVRFTR